MMDSSKTAVQRTRKMATRSRKLNELADERLKQDLRHLDVTSQKLGKDYKRRMALLQNELEELGEDRLYFDSQMTAAVSKESPRVTECLTTTSLTNLDISCPRRSVGTSLGMFDRHKDSDDKPAKQRFHPCSKSGCKLFPCRKPSTYHGFGLQSVYQNWADNLTKSLSATDPLRGALTTDVDRPLSTFGIPFPYTPRFEITCNYMQHPNRGARLRARENHVISNIIKHGTASKPEEWSTNYGRPVSFRQLLKPVSSTSVV